MSKKSEVLEKQVAEVRRVLLYYVGADGEREGSSRMDRRIGSALEHKNVTAAHGGGWGESREYHLVIKNNRLSPEARLWIEQNGMLDLADRYDRYLQSEYKRKALARLMRERAEAVKALDAIDEKIKKLEES